MVGIWVNCSGWEPVDRPGGGYRVEQRLDLAKFGKSRVNFVRQLVSIRFLTSHFRWGWNYGDLSQNLHNTAVLEKIKNQADPEDVRGYFKR